MLSFYIMQVTQIASVGAKLPWRNARRFVGPAHAAQPLLEIEQGRIGNAELEWPRVVWHAAIMARAVRG